MPHLVMRLEIRGIVQGVYYRQSMIEQALQLGVSGWVRNRRDGSVEATLAGAESAVRALIAWSYQGPPDAVVQEVKLFPCVGEFDGFQRLPTV